MVLFLFLPRHSFQRCIPTAAAGVVICQALVKTNRAELCNFLKQLEMLGSQIRGAAVGCTAGNLSADFREGSNRLHQEDVVGFEDGVYFRDCQAEGK